MRVLGIETSCDETAAAVLENGEIVSNVISSQIRIHREFGGVIPEFASRYHLAYIRKVVASALQKVKLRDLDAIAVTRGPGLKGSLLIGTMFARSLAHQVNIPVIGINHLEGHLLASMMCNKGIDYPFIGLLVSGGHTSLFYVEGFGRYELLGQTVDDAVGEAFDKVSSVLNLGYPGGPAIEKFSKGGNPLAFVFPRAMLKKENFDFSFSGIKTAVLYEAVGVKDLRTMDSIKKIPVSRKRDIAASFQAAVVDVLVQKTLSAAKRKKVAKIVLAGGVARNTLLRETMQAQAQKKKIEVYMPSPILCTDNAAMIAYIGYLQLKNKQRFKSWEVDSNLKLGN